MTDLERRALLGDREAQEECTRQGIVLPCPFCGGVAHLIRDKWASCEKCGTESSCFDSKEEVIRVWNTRAAPPVGRCGTCKDRYTSEFCECRPYDAYCSDYEPEEAEAWK